MKHITTTFFFLLSASLVAQDLSNGKEYYENNQPDKAERIFKSVSEESGNYGEAQYYLGRLAFDKEDYDAAEEYFEEAIDQDEANSDYHLWLGNTFGVVAQNSNVFKQGLLAPKIKSQFERAVELDNRNEDALSGLVQYYTQAPGFMGGSYQKALEMADKLGEVNKLRGHSARITVYSAQEKYDLVEREYKSAAAFAPAWNINLGYFYQQRKEYDKAFEIFERLAQNDEYKWSAVYQIGRTSALSGKKADRGIQCLQEYLTYEPKANQPSHAGAKMRLAMIYEKNGDKSKAISLYKEALQEEPEMTLAREGLKRLE